MKLGDQLPGLGRRLLISPSSKEAEFEPALSAQERANVDNFHAAAWDWRGDARTHNRNVTFFYFAGHGFQRRRNQHVMVMDRFLEPNSATLFHAIDTQQLVDGMAPTPEHPTITNTQFYFIDACRTKPEAFSKYELTPCHALWDIPVATNADRMTPLFYTTAPGHEACGLRGKETVFRHVVRRCR